MRSTVCVCAAIKWWTTADKSAFNQSALEETNTNHQLQGVLIHIIKN